MSSLAQTKSVWTLTLAAALSLTACGAKKEVYPVSKNVPQAPVSDVTSKKTPSVSTSTGNKTTPAPKKPAAGEDHKKLTGFSSNEGLVYTDSSDDDLLAYLRHRNEALSSGEQKSRNLETAQKVTFARLSVVHGTPVVTLDLGEETYVLTGTTGTSRAAELRIAEGTSGAQEVEGTWKCLDKDGGCDTSLAHVLIGSRGARAAVSIVFRNSLADLYVKMPLDDSQDPTYLQTKRFFENSESNTNTDFKVDEVYLRSFQVVNGRSGFDTEITGQNGEFFGFAGPLLAPKVGSNVNLEAKMLSPSEEDTGTSAFSNDQLNLANSITSAHIVNNNGEGKVGVSFELSKGSDGVEHKFVLEFTRIKKSIVELSETNLK